MNRFADFAWTFARAVFGFCLAAFHGYPKIFEGKMAGFASTVAGLGFPFPTFFAWAAALSEFVGGLLIAIGLATRPAAAFAAFTMMVALFRHRTDPFARMEDALLYFSMFVLIFFRGGGPYALDRFIRVRSPIGSRGGG